MQVSQGRADRIILVENEEQRANATKLAAFLDALEEHRPPHRGSDIVKGSVDANGVCRIQMFCRQDLYDLQTLAVEFPIGHKDWTYERVVTALRKEWEAMMGALFLKTFAPDLYNADMSPVALAERQTVQGMDLT